MIINILKKVKKFFKQKIGKKRHEKLSCILFKDEIDSVCKDLNISWLDKKPCLHRASASLKKLYDLDFDYIGYTHNNNSHVFRCYYTDKATVRGIMDYFISPNHNISFLTKDRNGEEC